AQYGQARRGRMCPIQRKRDFATAERCRLLFEEHERSRSGAPQAVRDKIGMFREKAGARITRPYIRMREDRMQLVKISRQTYDVELLQRSQGVVERRRE